MSVSKLTSHPKTTSHDRTFHFYPQKHKTFLRKQLFYSGKIFKTSVQVFTVYQSKYSSTVLHLHFFSLHVSGRVHVGSWILLNLSFSVFLPNRVTHWPIGITMQSRKRLEKKKQKKQNKCGHVKRTIHRSSRPPGEVPSTARQLWASKGKTAHFLLHPALRWSLFGSTGCSDVYG